MKRAVALSVFLSMAACDAPPPEDAPSGEVEAIKQPIADPNNPFVTVDFYWSNTLDPLWDSGKINQQQNTKTIGYVCSPMLLTITNRLTGYTFYSEVIGPSFEVGFVPYPGSISVPGQEITQCWYRKSINVPTDTFVAYSWRPTCGGYTIRAGMPVPDNLIYGAFYQRYPSYPPPAFKPAIIKEWYPYGVGAYGYKKYWRDVLNWCGEDTGYYNRTELFFRWQSCSPFTGCGPLQTKTTPWN